MRQVTLGGGDDLPRHTGELRDLEAVAAIGGSFLDGVQEHERLAVLGGIQMHVGAAGHSAASPVSSK